MFIDSERQLADESHGCRAGASFPSVAHASDENDVRSLHEINRPTRSASREHERVRHTSHAAVAEIHSAG